MEHVVARIKAGSMDPMVIALHDTGEPELILNALCAGAHEFLHPPLKANLQQARERKSLVSCPGDNVIASDPSHCCETVSKVVASNRPTASGVG
jgi:hypothetical protein